MIQPQRIQALNKRPARRGRFVLYWMQASQRATCNHALEYAVRRANELKQPVVAAFGLTDAYPEANERHYAFLLEGLAEIQQALARRGIRLVVRRGAPAQVALALAERASLLVTDRGYLRHQRRWRRAAAAKAPCPVVQVETDAVVPAGAASRKEEYAARTIRPKLQSQWKRYLVPLRATTLKRDSLSEKLDSLRLESIAALLASLRIDRGVGPTAYYRGGTAEARRRLRAFLRDKLGRYGDQRNDPTLDIQSHMSPYLHFGQISPLEIALAVRRARGAGRKHKQAYLEELLVRRELAINFVLHNDRYDSYACLPAWARATLRKHARDRRQTVYTYDRLVAAATHDPYWNAAMREMVHTGKMHNYMRMYWGKKILEWTRSPRAAFRRVLRLNNCYFLDGRDPASYANVAWCFGKHDRPWGKRNIFGTVRYMAAAGLERKFHMDDYVRWVDSLAE